MCAWTCTLVVFSGRAGSSATPIAVSVSSVQFLASEYLSPLRRKQGSLEKELIPGVEQGKDKVSLKYLVPESEEVLKE